MSSLTVHFFNPYNPCPDGLKVEAWLASNFLHAPASTDAYPPGGSHVATGTTSGGSVTLTGLSGVAYYVSIIDESNKPTFFYVPAAYVGGGTFTARYTPDTVTKSSVASVLSMFYSVEGGPAGSAITPATNIPYCNEMENEVGFAGQLMYAGTFSSGAVVVPFSGPQFVWPDFATQTGTWTWELGVNVTDAAGVNNLFLDSGAVSIVPFPVGQVNPNPKSAWLLGSTGSDLVYHSGTGYKTTAGGFYIVVFNLLVVGNPGTMT